MTATQQVTNDVYHFHFLLPASWSVQGRSARNEVTYGSPNHQATVDEYGFPAMPIPPHGSPAATFLDNQWRYGIPAKHRMDYFAQGTRGTWSWLAESWQVKHTIHYAYVYVNHTVQYLMLFAYPAAEAGTYNPVVNLAVRSFQP